MISLIICYNQIARNIYTIRCLQKLLTDTIREETVTELGSHNAATWAEIFSRLTELEGHISETVVNGIIRRAEEKYGNVADTEENLEKALHLARHFNEKNSISDYSYIFAALTDFSRALERRMLRFADITRSLRSNEQ